MSFHKNRMLDLFNLINFLEFECFIENLHVLLKVNFITLQDINFFLSLFFNYHNFMKEAIFNRFFFKSFKI